MRAPLSISPELATQLIAPIAPDAGPVQRLRLLAGGAVNQVMELRTQASPRRLVLKVNASATAPLMRREHDTLVWYRTHTALPVPRPIGWFNTEASADPADDAASVVSVTCSAPAAPADSADSVAPSIPAPPVAAARPLAGLLIEYVPGNNLAAARLSPCGAQRFQAQLAAHLTHLHGHTAPRYGNALDGPAVARWTQVFGPMLARELSAVADALPSRARWVATEVLDHLDAWLPEQNRPRLIHGDLWAANIIVDDLHPDRPNLAAFIDCGATYADVEYELAYLSLFQTINPQFMSAYGHTIAKGFRRRCHVYWLNAMLLHIRIHGERYVDRLVQVTEQLRKLR